MQVIIWAGVSQAFACCLQVFDEAHKAKNLINSKGGLPEQLCCFGATQITTPSALHSFIPACQEAPAPFPGRLQDSPHETFMQKLQDGPHNRSAPACVQGTRRRRGRLWSSCSWCCRAPRSSTPPPLAPRSPPTWCVPFGPDFAAHDCPQWAACLARSLTLISLEGLYNLPHAGGHTLSAGYTSTGRHVVLL